MTEEDKMTFRVLQVYQFPCEEKKTADNLRASLNKMANELGINDMVSHFHYVTDQGSNIKAALNSRSGLNAELSKTVLQENETR